MAETQTRHNQYPPHHQRPWVTTSQFSLASSILAAAYWVTCGSTGKPPSPYPKHTLVLQVQAVCSGQSLLMFSGQKTGISDTHKRNGRKEKWICLSVHFCFMELSSPSETHILPSTNGNVALPSIRGSQWLGQHDGLGPLRIYFSHKSRAADENQLHLCTSQLSSFAGFNGMASVVESRRRGQRRRVERPAQMQERGPSTLPAGVLQPEGPAKIAPPKICPEKLLLPCP